MSNPTFRSGPISFPVKTDVSKFRLVAVDAEGVAHAGASGPVFGATTTSGKAPAEPVENSLSVDAPNSVAVHIGPATVPLEVDGDAADFAPGDPVYAAASGKVSATGTVLVGVAARAGSGSTVKTVLSTPVAV